MSNRSCNRCGMVCPTVSRNQWTFQYSQGGAQRDYFICDRCVRHVNSNIEADLQPIVADQQPGG